MAQRASAELLAPSYATRLNYARRAKVGYDAAMTTKTITINASERVALAAQNVADARLALSMAEAELRVWQKVEREAEANGQIRTATISPATDGHGADPRRVGGNRDLSNVAQQKRDRRPADRWMNVLAHLGRTPLSHDDLAAIVAPLGVDKRTLGDQVRRYLGPLGLLDERGGKLELTARARKFLLAYTKGTVA